MNYTKLYGRKDSEDEMVTMMCVSHKGMFSVCSTELDLNKIAGIPSLI